MKPAWPPPGRESPFSLPSPLAKFPLLLPRFFLVGFCTGETQLRLLGRNRRLPQMPRVPSITLWQQLAEPRRPGGAEERAGGVSAVPLPLLGVPTKHPLAVARAKAIPDCIPLWLCRGEDEEGGSFAGQTALAWGQTRALLQGPQRPHPLPGPGCSIWPPGRAQPRMRSPSFGHHLCPCIRRLCCLEPSAGTRAAARMRGAIRPRHSLGKLGGAAARSGAGGRGGVRVGASGLPAVPWGRRE